MGKRSTIYNDNLTQDWDNVSDKNKKLVKEFMQYCKSTDKSPMTMNQYEQWLRVFFCWNYKENGDKFFIDLKKRDFVYYFGYLRDLGMSSNRIASLKSALSSLSSEIELLCEDLYPNFRNQLRGLEPVHITAVREKTVVSGDKLEEMLSTLVEKKEYQLACYLALVCSSGSRKAEMLQMKPEFFVPENVQFEGYMYCTPKIRAKGRGKQGKMIHKYVIKDAFDPYFELWMKEREKLGIKCDSLFVTNVNGEWKNANVSTANHFAKQISTMFNIDWYSHSGRHYFCTLLKSLGLSDDIVRIVFSWASVDLVRVYDDTPVSDKLFEHMVALGKKAQKDSEER